MKSLTFKGGIHPPERKEISENYSIENVFPSTKIVSIPVTQGGAPNQPIVKVGDSVSRGQKIAESDAFMSAPVHSSIAGTVKKIEMRPVAGNINTLCIVIEDDGSNRTDFMEPLNPDTCTKEEALARVKDAGIVGMGGAAFPTHVKLNPPKDKKIKYVLGNAAECEPYLTIDYRTILESTDKIIDGLHIEMKITDAEKGIIVLEDNKKNCLPILQTAIEKLGYKDSISVVLVKTKYPQGGEKSIVKAVLNKEIPAGKLPADIGCVISNIGTMCAISEAFREGKPLIDRGLTLSGGALECPKNVSVPIGTFISDLIPNVVKLDKPVKKIISGGPMMGFTCANTSFPVAKNTSGVLFLTGKEADLSEEGTCIGCGRCVKVCPIRLTPVMMVRELKADNIESAKKFGLMDCIECGCCSYVCPGNVKLVQRFRMGKAIIRNLMAKKGSK